MFRIWSIWKERNYIKLFPAVQLWELHLLCELPNHDMTRYSKENFVVENEAKYATKEFFRMAYNMAVSGAHSILEGKTILFYDYVSAFEDSDLRIQKMTRFLDSLNLGTVGTKAQQEFIE